MHIEGSMPTGVIPNRPSDETYPSVYGSVIGDIIPVGPGEVQAYVNLNKDNLEGDLLFKLPVFCASDENPDTQIENILNSAIMMACQGMVIVP